MRKLIYSMAVSLDGFIAGPDGDFTWSVPDEELHRFHNQQVVEGNARLAAGDAGEEVAKLKEQPGKDLAVGGAGPASTLIALGLVDEYRLFVYPVVVGGGTPYFPGGVDRIDLELVETRTFGSRVVYLRYART
jgi:dihydrofolate reductase